MTARASTTRRSPRRHLGAWVVSHYIAAIQTAIQPVRRHFPSVIGIAAPNSPAGGGANNSGSRCDVGDLSCCASVVTLAMGPDSDRESVACSGDTGNQFNADRLTFVGLKNETDPACRECSQGSAAHPGGRHHQRPPAFRSQIRQFGGCVRLSGGQTFQCHQNTLRAHDVACVNAERISYRRGRQQSNDRGAAIKGAWRGVLMGLTFNAAAAGNVDPRTKTVKTPGPRAGSSAISKSQTALCPRRSNARPAAPSYQPRCICRASAGPGLALAGVGLIERYVERFRDVTPILFLCARHLRDSSDRQAAAIEQLHVLMRQLAPVMEAAGLMQAPAGKRSR